MSRFNLNMHDYKKKNEMSITFEIPNYTDGFSFSQKIIILLDVTILVYICKQ